MGSLADIFRRHLAEPGQGEKGEKGDKGVSVGGFSPLSPFSHPTGEPWNELEARRLMEEADALVEARGLDGNDSVIQTAAAMVTSANLTGDMETLRFACGEFTAAVRDRAREKREIREKRGNSGNESLSVDTSQTDWQGGVS